MFAEPIRLAFPPDPRLQRTYIWCTEDEAGLEGFAEITRPFAERARDSPDWRFHHLAAIHDAYVEAPEAIADLFDRAARGV
jgi:hypothetical protein